jgi:hypothetical protein
MGGVVCGCATGALANSGRLTNEGCGVGETGAPEPAAGGSVVGGW